MFRIPFGKASEEQRIACLNWPELFPYEPDVRFSVYHDNRNIYLSYRVTEQAVKAEEATDGKPVYMDSCVECFIQPDPASPYYYNFEWNAIGTLSLSRRTGRQDPEDAPAAVLAAVEAHSSFGREPFAEKAAGPWTLDVKIPVEAFWKDNPGSLSGKNMKMNLYKCGDGLKVPHHVTWQPIRTASPDYHRPEFFVEVEFE